MSPPLATLVYSLGILCLFYLNRDKSSHTSKALWIPVIWFWILGSRAVSLWLGGPTSAPSVGAVMEGSPTDALFFFVLLVSGLVVLVRRGNRALSAIVASGPILWYFAFCLLSVVWSDFADVAMKRWIKATGDLIMALVVVTDAQPLAALRRLFSRLAFILLPATALLIKYYPNLGRAYDPWTGQQFVTGVTTDKNILGVSTYVLAVGTFWQVLRLWRNSSLPNRSRQLTAQCIVLGFSLWILSTANSVTSEVCFMFAAFLMVVTGLSGIRGRPSAVHATVLTIVLIGGVAKLTGVDAAVVQALGRRADLTGRASDIWPLLISMAPNALVGAGFESFWLGPRLQKVFDTFPNLYVSEAHNGYIELYLNLGVIGIGFIVAILIQGYRRSVAAVRIDPGSGSLMLAYVLTSAIYSYTEAGFRPLDYAWSFLILFIVAAGCISETPRTSPLNIVDRQGEGHTLVPAL